MNTCKLYLEVAKFVKKGGSQHCPLFTNFTNFKKLS